MGVDVIESKTRTARKPHRCDYCGEIIGKGEYVPAVNRGYAVTKSDLQAMLDDYKRTGKM